ncbi:MAG TPA: hypothetical protein PKM73_20065 [Verrucomicrobiota bacterium]|nr:hypothetical protein [Verrucomicrobiota bacterium]HNU50592.1 hypothetical protein [Verrucomicrobiota bacterium]
MFDRWCAGTLKEKRTAHYAGGTSHTYAPAWRFTAPSVTFQIRYPVGIVPVVGSAVTAAGRIRIHVPGVPAPVHRHSPPSASHQNPARAKAPRQRVR